MNLEEENVDDFDDIVFVMQYLVFDVNQLLKTVADEWLKVRHGTTNYIQAYLATLLAIRRGFVSLPKSCKPSSQKFNPSKTLSLNHINKNMIR